MSDLTDQDEREAIEYAEMRVMLSKRFQRNDNDWLNIPVWVLWALLARATRAHD